MASQNFSPSQQRQVVTQALHRAFPKPMFLLVSSLSLCLLQQTEGEKNKYFNIASYNFFLFFFFLMKIFHFGFSFSPFQFHCCELIL